MHQMARGVCLFCIQSRSTPPAGSSNSSALAFCAVEHEFRRSDAQAVDICENGCTVCHPTSGDAVKAAAVHDLHALARGFIVVRADHLLHPHDLTCNTTSSYLLACSLA